MSSRERLVCPLPCPGITCRDKIVRWLKSRMDSSDDAEDVAGEICVHCLQGVDWFRGDADIATWLHRITRNVFIDYLRARGRRAERETCVAADVDSMSFAAPEVTVDSLDPNSERVRLALLQLTPRDRCLLAWKYEDGQTYAEIAARLHISAAAASQALYRARSALRSALDAQVAAER